ncbi:MAG: ABC transporter ATP-binding protein [Clostridia bacterium]|nr:ABC transporter ATP-binding protein [Clostridia bacterium]
MKRWLRYAAPYRLAFILGPLSMIVESVGEVVMPLLLQNIYATVKRLGEAPGSTTSADVLSIVGTALLMVGTAALMLLGGVGGAYFGAKASVNFAADLRSDIYRRVQDFSFTEIDRFSTGSLVTRLTNDVTQMQHFVNMLLRMCMRSPIMLIGALIMAVALRPDLAAILLVSVPLLVLVQFLVIRVGFPRFTKMQARIDHLNSTVQENLTNVRVVKSFVREGHEREKFARANDALRAHHLRAMNVMLLSQPLMMIIMYSTILAVVSIGGRQVLAGTGLTAETLTTFITYINQILMSLMMLTMLFMNSSRAMASARRIREVLDTEPGIRDEEARHKEARVTRGEIELRGVSFRYYKQSPERVLSSIDLHIAPGETVGIIGGTGCGKTTLVSLIPRLYDADEGCVLVDGIDVRDYRLEHLRNGVGMVLQKNLLFSGSVADNLRWGDGEADEATLRAAAAAAEADGFVSAFPEGYETAIVQGGQNVSGGQKQRLCIARALLKKPKILILDDSTSAVDTATEARIRRAFREELADSTKIIIAQRIGSVREADRIVVLGEGAIVGIGTHEELLATCTEYREIYESQCEREEATEHGTNA